IKSLLSRSSTAASYSVNSDLRSLFRFSNLSRMDGNDWETSLSFVISSHNSSGRCSDSQICSMRSNCRRRLTFRSPCKPSDCCNVPPSLDQLLSLAEKSCIDSRNKFRLETKAASSSKGRRVSEQSSSKDACTRLWRSLGSDKNSEVYREFRIVRFSS